jgi:hypothetical protein
MSRSKLCIYLWKRWIWPTHTPPQIKNLQADDKYKQEPRAQTAFLPSKFPAIPWDGRIPKPGRRRWGNGRIWATQHRLRGPKTIEVSYYDNGWIHGGYTCSRMGRRAFKSWGPHFAAFRQPAHVPSTEEVFPGRQETALHSDRVNPSDPLGLEVGNKGALLFMLSLFHNNHDIYYV